MKIVASRLEWCQTDVDTGVSCESQGDMQGEHAGECGLTLDERTSYNRVSTGISGSPARGVRPISRRRVLSSFLFALLAIPTTTCLGSPVTVGASAVASIPPGASTREPALGGPSGKGTLHAVAQDLRGATFEYVPGEARFDTLSIGNAVYTRVSLVGAVIVEPPGRPALPTAYLHVAVPDGMSPRLRVSAEEWNERAGAPPPLPVTRERFIADDPQTGPVSEYTTDPDPAIYARTAVYPAQGAELGRGGAVGEMWVVPIAIHPVRWDPRARAYRLLRQMTLRVDFIPATDAERTQRPAFRRGGESGAWQRVQEGLVKNYVSARSFPLRPKSAPRPAGRVRVAQNPEFKISITKTSWVAVNFATLAGAGFPSGIAINSITVTESGYDDVGDSAVVTTIPVVARDNNFNGTFDASDAITFYARSLRDRVGAASIENRYTDTNVYWLTWGSGTAAVPGTITGLIPDPSPAMPTSFLDTIHLEQNQFMLPAPRPAATPPFEAVDYFFWTNGGPDVPDAFDSPIQFIDPDVTQPFRIRSYYQGQNNSAHRLSIYYQSSSGVTDTLVSNQIFFNQETYLLDTGFTIPGAFIGNGTNHYRHFGDRQTISGGPFIQGSKASLNWIDFTYSRRYVAPGGMLQFTSAGVGGITEIRVDSLAYSNVEIYDVTVPTAPLLVTDVTVNPISPVPPRFQAVFRTDATAGERRFIAVIQNQEIGIPSTAVAQDVSSSLAVPGAFPPASLARSIIITPQSFLAPATRLANFRRGQGYVVEVADIQDVYDEFNGGVKSARAIRRYLRHAYLTWTPRPTFVVLAGDASMDCQHHLATSGVDWVPTYLQFEPIAGPPGNELVAHDSHYSINLSAALPGDSDYLSSLFLARIPASSALDLDLFVTKVIQYENFLPTDTWRGRMLLVSDDEYSSGIFSASSYCHSPIEAVFRQASQDMVNIAAASQSGQDLRSDFFDLATYSDQLASACQNATDPACRQPGCVSNGFRTTGGAVDQFHSQLTQGALILNFQAHANRYLIAHEFIFCSTPARCTSSQDYDKIGNFSRPALLMIWGCHANQFPDGPSADITDSTDALGEQWLLLPNRGSIGSLGSSAYEFANTNGVYNTFTADAFFASPPTLPPAPGEPRRARWILGEVIGAAAARNGLSTIPSQSIMNRTMNLLGDPMLRMDALPPRIFEVTLGGAVNDTVSDGDNFTSDSPTDSVTLIAKIRDEAGVKNVSLAERDLATGIVTPVDSTLYSVAIADTGRLVTLTGRARPRNGNYDLQVRAIDGNDRLQIFTLEVRTPVRYLANGTLIVNGVFVEDDAVLRAEVTTPIPVTVDSLQLTVDGIPVVVTKTRTDMAGRQWVLESLREGRGPGTHTLQIAIGGSVAGLDRATYQVSAEFTMRGVAVVSPKVQGTGCGGSIFQFELSSPATKAELLLMTVAGRRVSSVQLPGNAGFNVYCWDGLDSQGHETATGLYLYRIRATDASGRTVSQDGRMIRPR